MNRYLISSLLVLGFSSIALADTTASVEEVAEDAGLRAREVQMLAGAPSAFAEYRTSYFRVRDQAISRGLDPRTLAIQSRHQHAIDRAVSFALRSDSFRTRRTLVAAR